MICTLIKIEKKMTKDKNQNNPKPKHHKTKVPAPQTQSELRNLNLERAVEKLREDLNQHKLVVWEAIHTIRDVIDTNDKTISDKIKKITYHNKFLVAVCSITIILYTIKVLS